MTELPYPLVLLQQGIVLYQQQASADQWALWITESQRYIHEVITSGH